MFSEPQVKALSSKLSAKYVRTRQSGSLTLSYIEGWHAIAEAMRCDFGGIRTQNEWKNQDLVLCSLEVMKLLKLRNRLAQRHVP
jgi:hypothetical protein